MLAAIIINNFYSIISLEIEVTAICRKGCKYLLCVTNLADIDSILFSSAGICNLTLLCVWQRYAMHRRKNLNCKLPPPDKGNIFLLILFFFISLVVSFSFSRGIIARRFLVPRSEFKAFFQYDTLVFSYSYFFLYFRRNIEFCNQ